MSEGLALTCDRCFSTTSLCSSSGTATTHLGRREAATGVGSLLEEDELKMMERETGRLGVYEQVQ